MLSSVTSTSISRSCLHRCFCLCGEVGGGRHLPPAPSLITQDALNLCRGDKQVLKVSPSSLSICVSQSVYAYEINKRVI